MARAPFQILVYPYRRAAAGHYVYALLRRSDAGFWQGVAGGGEDDETPKQAAQREAAEEAGITSNCSFVPLATTFSVPVTAFPESYLWGDSVYVIPAHCFGVEVSDARLVLSPEHTEYRWFTYEGALEHLQFDGDRTALWELNRRLRALGPRDTR